MGSVESITQKLDKIDSGTGHFTIEDFVLAQPRKGEDRAAAMRREHPRKKDYPYDFGLTK